MQPVPSSEFLEPAPRTWPKVLGILGILWGFIGTITSALAVAGVGREAQPPVLQGALGSLINLLGLALAVVVLVAGVQLLRRRAMAVHLLRAWAPLTMLVQGLVVVLMLANQPEFERAYREQLERENEARSAKSGQAAAKLPEGMEKAMFAGGAGCGGFMAIVPTGIVAIFAFGARGREAIAEWSSGTAA